MNIRKAIFLTLLMTVFAIGLSAEYAQAQGVKMGFVNDQKIRNEYKAFQTAADEFNLEYKAWEEEATAMQIELQEALVEYDKQKLILSDEKKKEKEASLRVKQEALDDFTRQIFGPGGKAERKERQLLEPILEKVNQAIEAVALEGNFDVIFTMNSALGYIKPIYDVTDKVMEKLEQQEE